MNETIETQVYNDCDPIENRIKQILASGKAVKFTNILNGVVKIVTEWNMDDGDLLAVYSTGAVKWVCPFSPQYEISEINLEDIPKE